MTKHNGDSLPRLSHLIARWAVAGVSIGQALSRVTAREPLGFRFGLAVVVGIVFLIDAIRLTRRRMSAPQQSV